MTRPQIARALHSLTALNCGLLCLAAIWTVFQPIYAAKLTSAVLFVVFCVVCQGHFRLRERALLTIAIVITAIALLHIRETGTGPIVADLSRAGYLAAFMMLLTSLRDGAYRSPSVLEIGRFLTDQPPGRRYVALHIGGHFMGVLLNFGAISLLGPLIKRGVEAVSSNNQELAEIRLRRQISALSRGFSWFCIWAPTSIAQAVVTTTVVGARTSIIALAGIIMAVILIGAGWAEDRLTGYRARMRLASQGISTPDISSLQFPFGAMGRFLSVGALLIGMAWLISHLGGILLVSSIMIAAVPVTVIWMTVQRYEHAPGYEQGLWFNVRGLFTHSIPAGSPEAATLGLAGYIGILGASLVDHVWLANSIAFADINPIFIYIAVSAILPLASCVGLPPMMMVTFLGGLLVSLPDLQLQPTVLAFSLLIGWGLNLTGSPLSASSLVLSRVVSIPGRVHAWRWNGVFTIVSWLVAVLFILITSASLR